MNLPKLLSGCIGALGKSENWEARFDLSKNGFKQSFLALFLSLPFYYVCAAAVQKQRIITLETGADLSLPTTAFVIILMVYLLTFAVSAYVLCIIFDRLDRFRPWVIVRHWSVFFTAFLAALIMGLTYAGILPFKWAIYPVMLLYLASLAIDIRLAARIGGFEWGAAVLTSCLITVMGLAVLLIGISQYV